MKRFIFLLAMVFVFFSCKKDDTTDTPIDTPKDMEHLVVSSDFDWSSSKGGILNVQMENISDGNISTEGQLLVLVDKDENFIARTLISNNQAQFNVKLPEDPNQTYYLFYPNSANIQELSTTNGNVTMQFAPSNSDRYAANRSGLIYNKSFAAKYFNPNIRNRTTHDLGPNLVQNGAFTIDNIELDSRHWTYLRTPGKWYYTNNQAIHPSTIDGEIVYHNYSTNYEVIEQSFSVLGGSEFEFSMDFGSTSGSSPLNLWLDNFDASGNWIGETYVTTNGQTITSSGTILNNAVAFQFYIGLYANGWVDNVVYRSVDINPDTDGDGVNDVGDDYPNDPVKAYKINYPTTGMQTISFEDLWPAVGDYDFNDLIISYNSTYAVNADGQYVSADFIIDIDAVGGSIPLGLGIQFIDGNKTAYSTTFISNVVGEFSYIDPDVNNGIIVFNNRSDAMPTFYTNTSDEQTGDPVTVTCSVSIDPDFQGVLLPNIYVFYTNDRGREIHLAGMPATTAASASYFGTSNDWLSTPYRTQNGLPWAIEVVQNSKSYLHPLEKIAITQAYTQFFNWAYTKGAQNTTWYQSQDNSKVYIP
ncbi:MAG: LruC domain-containing protein [Bacteroidales bacterium]|nr:LruC domain-containing protein [Bacteroidales bacterium]